MNTVTSILPAVESFAASIDWLGLIQTALILAVLVFALGTVLRFIFGRHSSLTRAVSAALNLVLIYLSAIGLTALLPELCGILNHLPFMTLTGDRFFLWDPLQLPSEILFPSALQLAILAFLVNVLETYLPEGEKFFHWYFWRCVTGLTALSIYIILCILIQRYEPRIFGDWAIYILIGFWSLILLTGISNLVLSVVLTAANPVIGILYTFFFSNVFGKQFGKSILTTLLMLVIASALPQLGIVHFAFSDFSLVSYGPMCVIMVIALYLFGRFL